MYYGVENPHDNPEIPMFYNVDSKIDHTVFSVAYIKDIYRENIGKIEKASPYWVDQNDQVNETSDEHLITLGRYQQQFFGSFKPKPK